MIRLLLVLILFFMTLSVVGQWRAGLFYYSDATVFDENKDQIDATEVFASWDEFVRVDLDYNLNSKHAISSWVDLNTALYPANFCVGYKYRFWNPFFVEVLGRKLALFTPHYDAFSGDVDQSHRLYQGGVGIGLRKQVSIIELSLNPQFLYGTSEKSVMEVFARDHTNFRGLRTEISRQKITGLYTLREAFH